MQNRIEKEKKKKKSQNDLNVKLSEEKHMRLSKLFLKM